MPADQTRQGPAPCAALIGPNRHDRLPGMLRQPPISKLETDLSALRRGLTTSGWVSFRGGEKGIVPPGR